MKKLVAILCCIISLSAFSQTYPEFAPVGAQWNYNSLDISTGTISTTHLKCTQQTIMAGHNCKKVGQYYVYRDSLKMYILTQSNVWKILYDFSTIPGDSFYTHFYYGDSMAVVVLDTTDTVMNGYTLPMMSVHAGMGASCFLGDTCILNIGSLYYFYPQCFEPPTGPLRCYNDSLLGEQVFLSPCDTTITVGIQTLSFPFMQAKISPNPTSGRFNLTYHFKQSKNGLFQIYNLQEKLVLSDKLKGQSGNKNYTLHLPSSVYLYKITLGNGTFKTGKMVIY